MNKKDFGRLVAALREEILDENLQGMKQVPFAEALGESKATIGNIERGDKASIDADLLIKMAEVLQLTSRESQQFCLAALGIESRSYSQLDDDPDAILDGMCELMSDMQAPAFITDNLFNMVAANSSMVNLYGLRQIATAQIDRLDIESHNMMSLIFTTERFKKQREALGNGWDELAMRNMQIFRAKTLQIRFTERFIALRKALWKHRAFREYWVRAPFAEIDDYSDNRMVYYKHEKYGQLHYLATHATTLTSRSELNMAVYTPMSENTTKLFEQLRQDSGNKVYRMAKWEAL